MSLQQQPSGLTEQQVPIQQQRSPEALLVASFLRNHPLLKLRQGTVNGQNVDFFRYKRCIRALTSNDYQRQIKKYNLPPLPELLNNPQLGQQLFVQLISNQLVKPVNKLSTHDARQKGFNPTRQSPCLEVTTKCVLNDNEYFIWTFTPPNPWLPVYAALLIIGLLTLVCFPLWPMFMRRGAWYVSMLMLGLIGLLFVIAIIRLIVFLILSPFTKFWIFPNLFADVGFVDSFIPLYGFETVKVKGKKHQKSEVTQLGKATSTATEKSGNTVRRRVTMEEVAE